jgi:hypothetical protein
VKQTTPLTFDELVGFWLWLQAQKKVAVRCTCPAADVLTAAPESFEIEYVLWWMASLGPTLTAATFAQRRVHVATRCS